MKKYLVVTNIWGKKQRGAWNNLVDVFEEEREYFDTKEKAQEYIALFEKLGKSYDIPEKEWNGTYNRKTHMFYKFKTANERIWGWVLGDTETCTVLKWGGISMHNISKKDNALRVKDYLFRGENEVPKNYKWDIGEYEGWLQFRWGDGKNAVGYVEKPKVEQLTNNEIVDKLIDSPHLNDSYVDDCEEIENAYADKEDKERIKKLADRW